MNTYNSNEEWHNGQPSAVPPNPALNAVAKA